MCDLAHIFSATATATAEPGDVIALTAVDINPLPAPQTDAESAGTTFWVYGQTTSGNADWEQAAIISEAPAGTVDEPGVSPPASTPLTAISIQLPSSLPAHSAYLLYEVNGNAGTLTYSKPYVINQPQIWWTDQNNSYVGGKISLFGTNLSYGVDPSPYSDQTWVYLFPENSSDVVDGSPILLHATAVAPDPVTGDGAMDVNPYKVDIDLPSSVVAGNYAVEVYNGHGGIYGSSNAAQITVAPPIVSATFTLLQACTNADYSGSIWLNESEDLLDPDAVNAAIVWASSAAQGSAYGGPYTYVTIQMPPGMVTVTAATGPILLQKYVHLVGAGDTGNPATGTVMEAATGAELQSVVRLPYDPGPNFDGIPTPWDIGISNMSLDANGGLVPQREDLGYPNEPFVSAVIYTVNTIAGVTVQGVTIDATNENPASPTLLTNPVWDILFSTSSSNLQFLDSTFIGPGVDVNTSYSVFDNCHFIGCGAAGAQIVDDAAGPSNVSVTRCTDQSLVNNITSPGGNVEYDAACRLFESVGAETGVYIGNNTTSDMYFTHQADPGGGTNGGEQISVEDGSESGSITNDFAIYQNRLAGDGAESFITNTSGVTIPAGINIVIADNDISNVVQGIHLYDGGYMTEQPFGIYTDNSIHNVFEGYYLQLVSNPGVDNAPWFYGNVFSHNLINGIINQPFYYAETPAAFVISYSLNGTSVPQALMNIFDGNGITGAAMGLILNDQQPEGAPLVLLGETIVSRNTFESDGSSSSTDINNVFDDGSPIYQLNDLWQGFWLSGDGGRSA